MSEKKIKRPSIPRAVERELWLKAGGRCEFRGCNKYLYKDGVTQQPKNLANIAHIVSWTPTGPRGNEHSQELATDISNLMLLCSDHNNYIDDSNYVDTYTVELLHEFKQEHENRIYQVTGMGQDYGVRIIKLYSKIQGQIPNISDRSISEAIMPYYPLEGTLNMDLTKVASYEYAQRKINRIVDLHILSDSKEESYCIFIMAEIPYSCYLGYVLGNKVKADTFQFFRDTQDWKWKNGNFGHFQCISPVSDDKQSQVNLLIEVSGNINKDYIPQHTTYSIRAEYPSFSFLQSKEQVVEFRLKYREVLDKIRDTHGEDVIINLFIAAPNPITFELGRVIMKNLDPTIQIFDKVDNDLKYAIIGYLHERIRE